MILLAIGLSIPIGYPGNSAYPNLDSAATVVSSPATLHVWKDPAVQQASGEGIYFDHETCHANQHLSESENQRPLLRIYTIYLEGEQVCYLEPDLL